MTLQEYRKQRKSAALNNGSSTQLTGSFKPVGEQADLGEKKRIANPMSAMQAAQDANIMSMQASAQAQQSLANSQIEAERKRIDEQYNSLADYVQAQQDRYNAKKEEDRIKTEAENKAGAWMGATELVSGLVNLLGTTAGASSQTHKPVASDWQRAVDQKRLQRKQEMTTLQERIDAQRLALRQQKSNDDAKLTSLTANAQAASLQNQANIDAQKYGYAMQNIQAQREEDVRLASMGYKRDEKGNIVVDKTNPYWNQEKFHPELKQGKTGTGKGTKTKNGQPLTYEGKTYMIDGNTEGAYKDGFELIKKDLANSGIDEKEKKKVEGLMSRAAIDENARNSLINYVQMNPRIFKTFNRYLLENFHGGLEKNETQTTTTTKKPNTGLGDYK